MGPRFSILLPTHARADVIGLAIRSALVQTMPDFELLVVCDGCDEATSEVLHSFSDDRMHVFDLPKAPGFGWANRNRVLRQAVGNLIANLADDDLWLPDHLGRLSQAFEDEQVEWAYSRPLWMTDDGVAVPAAVDLRRPDHLAGFMEVGNSIPAPCIVHRRSGLERYGYWPDHLWQGELSPAIDWELWRSMLRPSGGRNLAFIPEPTVIHFRASWRDADRWGLPVWSEWAAEREHGTTWWPSELAVDMTGVAAPQEAAWRALEADPVGWAMRLRQGTGLVLDGWAGEAVGLRQHLVATTGQVHGLEQEVGRLWGEIAGREERISHLEDALRRETAHGDAMTAEAARVTALNATMLTSRSWRLMAPARTAGQLLRRAGVRVTSRAP
jgi:hypothetical protein